MQMHAVAAQLISYLLLSQPPCTAGLVVSVSCNLLL
jgi:hypothetical protein